MNQFYNNLMSLSRFSYYCMHRDRLAIILRSTLHTFKMKPLCLPNLIKYNGNYYAHTKKSDFKCWNCQTVAYTRPSLFCKNCSLIQSADQQDFNYFGLFYLEEQYNINTEQLTTNFRKLQNLLHPDKFSSKTNEEKVLSEAFSSLLNKAYSTLLHPLQRGLYMLSVHGINIEEHSITLDKTFLIDIMEWNESIEEADTKKSIEKLKEDIDEILNNTYKEVSKAFTENNLIQAKALLSKAKYFVSMLEKIKEKDV